VGIRNADAENVHASVTSSEGNEKFYLRCGFDEVVGNACLGDGNPLKEAGARGGDILFRFPRGNRAEQKQKGGVVAAEEVASVETES
jgi:hypothetical protein